MKLNKKTIPWFQYVDPTWKIVPLYTIMERVQEKNIDNLITNVLSLSYGRIIKRNVENNFGLLPESFESYNIVEEGDIILRLTDLQNDKKSLRVGLSRETGIITSAYLTLRPKRSIDVLSEYLYWLLYTYDTQKVFYGLGSGVRQQLNYEELKNMPIPLPPYEVQNNISKVLKSFDELYYHLKIALNKKMGRIEQYRLALITRTVTKGLNPDISMKPSEVEWLREVPNHWKISKFKYIAQTSSGATPSSNKYEEYYEGGKIPWIRTMDIDDKFVTKAEVFITEAGIKETACRLYPAGTLLVAMYGGGGTIGKSGLLKINSTTNQAICAIQLRCDHPEYYFYLLQFLRPNWMYYAEGSRRDPNINQQVVANMPVPVPPLKEQIEIASYLTMNLEKIDNLYYKLQEQIKKLEEYRSALIKAVITGQIDIARFSIEGTEKIFNLELIEEKLASLDEIIERN